MHGGPGFPSHPTLICWKEGVGQCASRGHSAVIRVSPQAVAQCLALRMQVHDWVRPFDTMLLAAAMTASCGSRGIQSSIFSDFALDVCLA